MAFSMAMSWNEGEEKMHKMLHVPEYENPTSMMLTPQASFMLQRGPLLALGTLDSQDRPWTTLWGGQPGFSEPLGGGIIGTRTIVDGVNDPVVQALVGGNEQGEMVQGNGKMVAGLAIDLMTRRRVKICGSMIAGSLGEVDVEFEDDTPREEGVPDKQEQLQLITKIEQSLGNCPKYLNQYEIRPALVTSKLVSQSASLSLEGKGLITNADMFFISSTTTEDMDTNHRGGPPGFVRILSDTEIVYPEYSGNRLYQTLGNLQMNPKVGITFPDYENGNVLYTTGTAQILVLDEAAKLLPGSNIAVKIKLDEARFVEGGLPFRGTRKIPSPYNPLVRTLATEGNIKSSISGSRKTARLTKKTKITSKIARFTFSVPGGISYKPGQWVALDFSRDMDYGYSHMRDDDPKSLNDDFVRTFTISSTPSSSSSSSLEKEFDITIRNVGPVTSHLFTQNERSGFEVPVLGIGGEFAIRVPQKSRGYIPYIAGGVGITPLLGQLETLWSVHRYVRLHWAIRAQDIDFVLDTFERYDVLANSAAVYLTGDTKRVFGIEKKIEALRNKGATVYERRIQKADLFSGEGTSDEAWYLCAGKAFRKEVLGWLEGKTAVFEDFDY